MKSLAREMGRNGTTATRSRLVWSRPCMTRNWVEANREKLVKFYPVRRLGQAW